jgi:hypothetical protein
MRQSVLRPGSIIPSSIRQYSILRRFSCKGYDTFGPFKLIGGLSKGHPDETDLENAVAFVKGLKSGIF